MVVLEVDNRETKFINDYQKDFMVLKNLDLGDFKIYNDKREILIERKTIADLVASIKDGRYKNQKLRMLEYRENTEKSVDLVYLLEGQISDIPYFEEKKYWGVLVNSTLRDKIQVIQTGNLKKTAEIILDIYEKLLNNKFEGSSHGSNEIHLESFKKSSFNKPENYFLGQLKLIPGISSSSAKILDEQFKNMKDLIEKIEENLVLENVKLRLKFLSDISLGKRKLGDALATKIISYVLHQEESLEKYEKELLEFKKLKKRKSK